jgi:hypothetical protein
MQIGKLQCRGLDHCCCLVCESVRCWRYGSCVLWPDVETTAKGAGRRATIQRTMDNSAFLSAFIESVSSLPIILCDCRLAYSVDLYTELRLCVRTALARLDLARVGSS